MGISARGMSWTIVKAILGAGPTIADDRGNEYFAKRFRWEGERVVVTAFRDRGVLGV